MDMVIDRVKMEVIKKKGKEILDNPDKILNYALAFGITMYSTGYFIRAIKK